METIDQDQRRTDAVSATNVSDADATFGVTEAMARSMAEAQSSASIGSVLVVEDHDLARRGVVDFLKGEKGVTSVVEADCFARAMKILAKTRIDLAIIDLGLPDLESPRELVKLRRRWPVTRVVVLSGSNSRSDILAALEAGVHGYLLKTASAESMSVRLKQIMGGDIYVPPCLADIGATGEAVFRPASEAAPSQLEEMKLTPRQREVLRLIEKGLTNAEIMADTGLSMGTVKMHVGNIMRALGAKTRSQAAAIARNLH